jgi:hypothetical protein
MGARYSGNFTSLTLAAVADTTTFTTNQVVYLAGGSATQRINISEVYIGGEATAASAVQIAVLARDSTAVTGAISGGRNGLLDGSGTAPATAPSFGTTAATTQGQRSATLHLLHLSYNAYGGIVRWVARPGEEPSLLGLAASLGEVSLSCFTGTTSAGSSGHILFEVA